MKSVENKDLLGRLALLTTTLIWGSSFVILKNTLDSVPTLWILAIRFCGAAVILLVMCGRRLKKLDARYLRGSIVMGACMSAAYVVQTYGLVYTTPGKNAFLTATYCIMVPFLAWGFNHKKPDGYNIGAAFLCFIGMGFVSLGKDLSVNIGDILTICCGLFYGLHIIATDKYVDGRDPMVLTALQFVTAGAITLIAALISGPFPQNVPGSAWAGIAYLCVMCSAVCFLLQTVGQKYTPPSAAAVIMTLESVFGTVISIVFYHEKLTAGIAAGFVLIFVSIIISETKLSFLRRADKKTDAAV
jgi:drug/metabolite transporter (DMT)-like permease